jgi:hypothetical protein
MNHCATCKHWGEAYFVDEDSAVLRVRHCEAVPHVWAATSWDKQGNEVLLEQYKETLAFAADASDYRADLYTKAEYGCPMWEEKT